MKNSKSIVLALIVALASWLFTDCVRGNHYDRRLVSIDSLLTHHPDSALASLNALETSELKGEADRAYHALLLTQARYRCYITATSDSDITLALTYYQRHNGDREKLTRAYIYKGAVAEELGDPEGAMRHYKSASKTVPIDNHYLQGYIKLRIGNIYRDHLVADSSDVIEFKEALAHFKQVPDSFYILTCLSEIGSSYIKNNRDSVLPYLHQARAMAQRLHEDDLLLINDIFIDEYKAFSNDPVLINEAKEHTLSLIRTNDSDDDYKDLLMISAFTLAKQNKPDSASLYLNRVGRLLRSANDSVFYYRCLAEEARCRGDVMRYQYFTEKELHINDSLTSNAIQVTLRDVEEKYDNETMKNEKLRYRNMLTGIVLGGLLALSLLALVTTTLMHKSSQRKRRLREYEDQIDQLHAEADELSARLRSNIEMSEGLKNAIRNQLDMYIKLIELQQTKLINNPSKFSKQFEESYKNKKPDSAFWKSLENYANSTHGDLIIHLRESDTELIESDFRFLSLYCCHLSTAAIMACMGYNDVHSVYNKRRRIASALSMEGQLDKFIREHEINGAAPKTAESISTDSANASCALSQESTEPSEASEEEA